jgi:hypothetical protein
LASRQRSGSVRSGAPIRIGADTATCIAATGGAACRNRDDERRQGDRGAASHPLRAPSILLRFPGYSAWGDDGPKAAVSLRFQVVCGGSPRGRQTVRASARVRTARIRQLSCPGHLRPSNENGRPQPHSAGSSSASRSSSGSRSLPSSKSSVSPAAPPPKCFLDGSSPGPRIASPPRGLTWRAIRLVWSTPLNSRGVGR